jgi:hypothetical protein
MLSESQIGVQGQSVDANATEAVDLLLLFLGAGNCIEKMEVRHVVTFVMNLWVSSTLKVKVVSFYSSAIIRALIASQPPPPS